MQEKDSGLDLISKGEIPKRVTIRFAGLRGRAGRPWRAGRPEATLSPGNKERWSELWAERSETTDVIGERCIRKNGHWLGPGGHGVLA